MISDSVAPLVRERSRVQSSLAAPSYQIENNGVFDQLRENPVIIETANCANNAKTRRVERGGNGAPDLPAYVQKEKSRLGEPIYYFRIGNGPRLRLRGSLGSVEFQESWRAAHHAAQNPVPKTRKWHEKNAPLDAAEWVLRRRLRAAKDRAKVAGRAFELDLDWAKERLEAQRGKCALTGIPFSFARSERGQKRPNSLSFDRKDNSIGYTKANTRLIIYVLNIMLYDWGDETFAHVARAYLTFAGPPTPSQPLPE